MAEAAAALREPWPSIERQKLASSFGIWLFLASEALFFGGLFLVYAIYRASYTAEFDAAASHTNVLFGTANTFVLLTSSFAMAVADRAAEAGRRRAAIVCMLITVGLGLLFLVIKGFEYREDLIEGLWPGSGFSLEPGAASLFFAIYWVTTGLHAIHVTIGIVMISTLAYLGWRRNFPLRGSGAPDVLGLYWHLVDIIWIFLYPLLYLVNRS